MKTNQGMKLGIGLLSVLLFLSGCMGKRTNPVQEGTISIKVVHPPGKNCLRGVQVYQYKDEFVVYGNVHRNFRAPYWFAKHIDVAVLGPDGKLQDDIKTQGSFFPFPQKSIGSLSFTVRYPGRLPPGATVIVAYHGNVGDTKVMDQCIKNLKLAG